METIKTLKEEIKATPNKLSIVKAINKLGCESLTGVSHIDTTEVFNFLDDMELYELGEIADILRTEQRHNKIFKGATDFYSKKGI